MDFFPVDLHCARAHVPQALRMCMTPKQKHPRKSVCLRIVHILSAQNVPLTLCTKPSNLYDYPSSRCLKKVLKLMVNNIFLKMSTEERNDAQLSPIHGNWKNFFYCLSLFWVNLGLLKWYKIAVKCDWCRLWPRRARVIPSSPYRTEGKRLPKYVTTTW